MERTIRSARRAPVRTVNAICTAKHTGAKHGNLSNWAHNVCPGRLYMAGQSLGGAMAAIFAFWANHASDPLDMGKPVTALYLFGADPPGPTGLTNGHFLG